MGLQRVGHSWVTNIHTHTHTVKAFSVVNETETDIFLKFPWVSYNPANVGNLIFSSSSFSKPSLYVWKFLIHILLKPSMQDFKHYLTRIRDECTCPMVSTFFGTTVLGNWNEDDLVQSCNHCWVFQISWHNEWKPLIAPFFSVLNSSAGISLYPLALLTAVLLRGYLTLHSRLSGSGWLTTPS